MRLVEVAGGFDEVCVLLEVGILLEIHVLLEIHCWGWLGGDSRITEVLGIQITEVIQEYGLQARPQH